MDEGSNDINDTYHNNGRLLEEDPKEEIQQ